jgi:hypothetical protein
VLSINIIDAPNYNAMTQCKFYTAGDVAMVSSITPQGLQQIILGPPQPVIAVSCFGMCVPTWGMCYDTNNQYVGPCCSGYCAATRCRPWVYPN